MKILFNIPVHENMDVVINTVENIKKYVIESTIIFHVNPVFKDFDKSRLDAYKGVYVNPNQFDFTKYHSILHILMANYYETKHLEYDYHCFFYSNEMFIRSGIESYMSGYECVFENYFLKTASERHLEMYEACSIPNFFQGQPYINNHVEGTMYSKQLIDKIFDFISENLMSLLTSKTSIEETVIPTLAFMFTEPNKRRGPYNHFRDWDRELSINEFDNLLISNQPCLVGHTAYGITGTTDQIYTIKPVHRTMSSILRQTINNR